MSSLPPIVAGRYRPLRVLGRGGMGVVYVVEHIHTGEQLALKVLTAQAGANASAVERFKREARAPAQIKSDHVVRVTDADVAQELGALFLVMELLEGSDLDQHTEGKPQPPDTVLGWFRQIARGLEKAHRLGIVHRDLKPENLFLTQREDGTELVKILDFGIAKFLAEASGTGGNATETGNVVGTPRYMAPEQAVGEVTRIGPAADIWALGMIAFRLLSGRDYFGGSVVAGLIAQVVYGPMPLPSEHGVDLGPAFDAWFQRSCDRDPDKRWPTVAEQVSELAVALRDAAPVEADSTVERLGAASTLAVTPAGSSSPTGSLGGSASAAPPPRRPRLAAWKVVTPAVALVVVVAVGAWMQARPKVEAPTARDLASSHNVTSTEVPTAPPATSAPAVESTAAEASATDAGSDAGRGKTGKPRRPGDPLREQY